MIKYFCNSCGEEIFPKFKGHTTIDQANNACTCSSCVEATFIRLKVIKHYE